MSTVFTCAVLLVGAYVATKIFDGANDDDPIIIRSSTTGLGRTQGDGRGGTGGGNVKRRRASAVNGDADDDDDDFNDGKRRMKLACDVGAYDINGNLWRISGKDDAKVFYPTKGGEGALVRVMTLNRAGRFIRRAFPSSPKGQSMVHFLDELHEEWESNQDDHGEHGIMPQGFGAMWPIFRGMLAGNHAADDNGAVEALMLAKYSAAHLAIVPFLLCAPKGVAFPLHLQRANWVVANSVVGNLPPRSANGRQFIASGIENFAMFLPAFWDEAFTEVFDSILKALRGQGDPRVAKKVRETADICLLLLFHGAVASWATAVWTQSRDVEILPDEAAERLKGAVEAVIDDLLSNRIDPYPHLNYLGPDGRLLRLVDATEAEERRLASAAGGSSGGGVSKLPTHHQPLAAAVSPAPAWVVQGAAGAFASPPPAARGGGLQSPSITPGGGGGHKKKGLCITCTLHLMDLDKDRSCAAADERWTHPTSLKDVAREEIERVVQQMPKWYKSRAKAEKWLAEHQSTAGH